MSSPFIPSPLQYTDIPGGGQQAIIVVAAVAPTLTQNQQAPGTFWLVPEPAGTGALYYLAGFVNGVPQWELISSATGNVISVLGTLAQITATTAAGVVTLSIPASFVAPGSITATSGALTVTNGNIVLGTAGNKMTYTSVATTTAAGANSAGSVPLVAGTATVATTAVDAASLIRLTRQGLNASTGTGEMGITTKTAGTSFVITSYTPGAVTTETGDLSTVFWEIVN